MRISFTGAQCSGKTTLLNKCIEHYGDRFEYVTEVTRPIARMGMPINESGDDDTQRAIIESHILNSTIENVIMDRCIIDGLLYTKHLYDMKRVNFDTWTYAYDTYLNLLNRLDVVFYTEAVEMVDDGVRSTSDSFRESMINSFNRWVTFLENDTQPEFRGEIIRLRGSVDDRFSIIKQYIG